MRKLILAAALAGCAIHVVPASAQEGAAQEGAAQTRVLSPAERADPAAAAVATAATTSTGSAGSGLLARGQIHHDRCWHSGDVRSDRV